MALTKAKRKQLEELLKTLEEKGGSESDLMVKDLVKEEVDALVAKVKGNLTLETIKKLGNDLTSLQKEFQEFDIEPSLKPLRAELEGMTKTIEQSSKTLVADFEKRIKSLPVVPDLTNEVSELREEFDVRIQELANNTFAQDLESIRAQLEVIVANNIESGRAVQESVNRISDERAKELQEAIDKVRSELNNRISNLGGGSQPLQVNVNSSVMSTKYADVNFLQGGNIGWSVADDDTLKRTNITASILVGGGGGGTVRVTSVLSVSSTLAAAASTDYAFFPNVGINLTLPTAVGNTNRYTIKNMVASSILVTADTGEDIDGATTALLSNQFESIDLQSNGSVWGII